MSSVPQQDDEPLSLEADYTLHVLSLFGTLFDPRAAPYIGVIPPDDIQPKVEEEEDGEGYYEPPPPFETSLCDFRLRAAYKGELEARQSVIDDLAARGELINENSKKPESKNIVLGDRLVPRNEKGMPTESELKKKRAEFLDKSIKKAAERRSKVLTQKKNKNQDTAQSEREETRQLMEEFKKIRDAEVKQRKAAAAKRRAEMEKRREMQMRKREEHLRKTEEAQKSIENLTYRSKLAPEAVAQYDFRSREKNQRNDLIRSIKSRKMTEDSIMKYNKQSIKPKPRTNPYLLSP
ncbi:hypothetical protein M9Y10_021884 [Tritrichomonas musculus]|uniref:Uncharacterized protein n=1 Tax=Tritrichomonas musculus TaxID=1915356 RepID=A0ABR2KSS3_9EUKA